MDDLFGKCVSLGDRYGVIVRNKNDAPGVSHVVWVLPDKSNWVNWYDPEKVLTAQLTVYANEWPEWEIV